MYDLIAEILSCQKVSLECNRKNSSSTGYKLYSSNYAATYYCGGGIYAFRVAFYELPFPPQNPVEVNGTSFSIQGDTYNSSVIPNKIEYIIAA